MTLRGNPDPDFDPGDADEHVRGLDRSLERCPDCQKINWWLRSDFLDRCSETLRVFFKYLARWGKWRSGLDSLRRRWQLEIFRSLASRWRFPERAGPWSRRGRVNKVAKKRHEVKIVPTLTSTTTTSATSTTKIATRATKQTKRLASKNKQHLQDLRFFELIRILSETKTFYCQSSRQTSWCSKLATSKVKVIHPRRRLLLRLCLADTRRWQQPLVSLVLLGWFCLRHGSSLPLQDVKQKLSLSLCSLHNLQSSLVRHPWSFYSNLLLYLRVLYSKLNICEKNCSGHFFPVIATVIKMSQNET